MAKKRITRKEMLKSPDEFLTLSNRVANYCREHTEILKYVGMGLLVAVVLYLAVNAYLNRANKKGQEAYNEAHYALVAALQGDGVPDEALQAAGDAFRTVADRHGLARSSRLALAQAGYVKFLDDRYDEAIALYKKFKKKISGKAPYDSLTNLALAACFEAKGDFKSGIEALQDVVEARNSPFREEALFSLARMYRLNNQSAEEKDVLESFVAEYKDSLLLPMAKARL